MLLDKKHTSDYKQIPSLLKVREVAQILGLGLSTIYQFISRGELPCVRFGRAVRVRPEDLEGFIEANVQGLGN